MNALAEKRMNYESIDPVIERWVQAHHLLLSTAVAGREARFWFTSRESECFQVSIECPTATGVTVNAWSIETDDDAELKATWTVAAENLEAVLIAATDMIELWARRTKTPERWNRS